MKQNEILDVLDRCCDSFTFPMLDNGYVYPAATRLACFRSADDWAMTIEVFGFSPRSGLPDTHVYCFGNNLANRKTESQFDTKEALDSYLQANPNNESSFVYPVDHGDWQDNEEVEFVAIEASHLMLRGRRFEVPKSREYSRCSIQISEPPRVCVFELCRYIADTARNFVLATNDERRLNVSSDMQQLLVLDEWHHPDVIDESNRPSQSQTFQQLALVLETGDVKHYQPDLAANTHWSNWPDGGLL